MSAPSVALPKSPSGASEPKPRDVRSSCRRTTDGPEQPFASRLSQPATAAVVGGEAVVAGGVVVVAVEVAGEAVVGAAVEGAEVAPGPPVVPRTVGAAVVVAPEFLFGVRGVVGSVGVVVPVAVVVAETTTLAGETVGAAATVPSPSPSPSVDETDGFGEELGGVVTDEVVETDTTRFDPWPHPPATIAGTSTRMKRDHGLALIAKCSVPIVILVLRRSQPHRADDRTR